MIFQSSMEFKSVTSDGPMDNLNGADPSGWIVLGVGYVDVVPMILLLLL